MKRYSIWMLLILGFSPWIKAQEQRLTAEHDSVLGEKTLMLDLGYDKFISKKNAAGAIDGVSAEQMRVSGATNVMNTLYGLLPGLSVRQDGTLPWDLTPALNVRGRGSNMGNSVLVLVDGVDREIGDLNVEEIESVTVLKDAAALALYGNRGADGVVCITTKRGGNHKLRTRIDYTFGVQTPFRVPEMADGATYASAVNEALKNDGIDARYSQADIQALQKGTSLLPDVNWKDQILRNTALNHDLNLSFDGSNQRMRYYIFANYTSNRGFFNHTDLNDGYSTQAEMYALKLRTNLEANITPTTIARMNMMGRLMQYQTPAGDGTGLANMYATPAIASPIRTPQGLWGTSQMFVNPLAQKMAGGYKQTLRRTLFGDLTLDQDLSMFASGLSAQLRVTYDNSANIVDSRTKEYAYAICTPLYDGNGNISDFTYDKYSNNTELGFSSFLDWQVMRTYVWGKLSYNRDFEKHHLTVDGIYSQGRKKYLGANNTYMFRDYILNASYNYDNRYLVNAVVSYAGSAKLVSGDKYRVYPAVAFAWILSNENFMKKFSAVDYLKLRASWGITGSDARLSYDMDKQFNGSGNSYVFIGSSSSDGMKQGDLPSVGIEPEKDYKSNIGIELGLWKGLSMQVDAFYNYRKNIAVSSNGTVSTVLGIGAPKLFTGEIKNYGGELTLGWQQKIQDFSYSIQGNVSYAKNKIINVEEAYHPYSYMNYTGQSIGQFYGLIAEGLYQENDFDAQGNLLSGLPSSTYEAKLQPGDIKYKDLNKDGKIDDYDYCYQMNTSLPEIYYGFSLNLNYKRWGLNAQFQGVARYSVWTTLNSIYRPLYGNNKNISNYYLENHWTADTPNARYPRLTTLSNNHNYQNSSLWVEKGDYLKLRDLEVYYKLPKQLTDKMRMSECKLFLKGMNLFSIDQIGIMDPEHINNEYPSARSYMVGASVVF